MVDPDQRDRFPTAKEALTPLYVVRYPEVILNVKNIEINVHHLGKKRNCYY